MRHAGELCKSIPFQRLLRGIRLRLADKWAIYALMAQLRPLSSIEVRTETQMRTQSDNCKGLWMRRVN